MSDKKMPPVYLWSRYVPYEGYVPLQNKGCELPNDIEYTLVHNNPEYHVIKKSDVDDDVYMMDILQVLERIEHACSYPAYLSTDYSFDGDIEILRNALIAQSDPDMVRIPRKVLEGMKKIPISAVDNGLINCWADKGYNQAINNVLNYKEGE